MRSGAALRDGAGVTNTNDVRQPRNTRDWSLWGWLGLLVVVGVHGLVMVVAAALAVLDTQGMCREPATPADLADARVVLAVVAVVAIGPWLAAALVAHLRGRPWATFVLSGLVVAVLPAYYLVSALTAVPADWSSDWCLF
jgi:hypothetical protein